MTPAQRNNLYRLLQPRHIAFVGGRDAAIAIGEAHRIGFPGAVWPVNPKREEIGGHKCFASISALPEAPDAVFLAVPVAQAIETVQQLNQRGAGGVVCYTAGFGEAGVDGKYAEKQLIEAAGDMALIGPNCYGVINYLSMAQRCGPLRMAAAWRG
jgi:acyl-CoA synthetase (NDP forming)